MFAVVEINGLQYKVEENELLTINKTEAMEVNAKLEFDKVLFINDDKENMIGKPYIKGAKVLCQYQEETQGKKIEVMKFRRRSNFKKIKGHRQDYSIIKIEKIVKP
ncbi:TPA: 50S ribosomal protein L21 [candidate division WOR-3 bacterium]|jgi:large subunit ribosomal protein L21|uniref:Large ribosomal subunit protein bL21 n=1 Tax=candidate division WOR-3 bacterium TaxID=2052148 RepID=A0A350HAZ1_UNCW3|nr:50S ribosomal protein L21 [candidate division WOR-3 bacterium]